MRWLRRWRERDDRHLIKATSPSPLPEIDPIEELARIVGEAQERGAENEGRFERLSRPSQMRDRRRPNP
jgi:hypothetical protein